tara:strand:- start:1107 stop:1319 length:213 start_codon:yes stop_codon:yes gene_type:complete
MTAITQTTWSFTCKICSVIRNALVAFIAFIVASGEIAGRSRAAAELTRQGYHEEAKALLLELKEIQEQRG